MTGEQNKQEQSEDNKEAESGVSRCGLFSKDNMKTFSIWGGPLSVLSVLVLLTDNDTSLLSKISLSIVASLSCSTMFEVFGHLFQEALKENGSGKDKRMTMESVAAKHGIHYPF